MPSQSNTAVRYKLSNTSLARSQLMISITVNIISTHMAPTTQQLT